jgi:acyl-CoA synthetase (NDP forming)
VPGEREAFTVNELNIATTAPGAARLQSLFRPKSVAIVGASEKSLFSSIAWSNLERFGFADHTHLVNRRGVLTHGRPTVTSCAELPSGVDVAFLMVPQAATIAALKEAAAAGIRNAVVLTSGYGEAGPAGKAAQAELIRTAQDLDLLLLGPNHLGFVNVADGIPVSSLLDLPRTPGHVGLIAQSGATAGSMIDFARMCDIGFSHVVTTGNEAMITASDVLDFLVDDEQTRAIALFIETVRRPEIFLAAVKRANAAGKAVVVLKLGTSELSARTAQAHTGSLVGDDQAIDAIFRQYGVIRVDSVEDLLITAQLAAFTGPLSSSGVGITSISGGACDVVADRGEELGLDLVALGEHTVRKISELLPAYGTPHNPLDVTGAAVIDPSLLTALLAAMAEDPNVALVATIFDLPWEEKPVHGAAAMCRAIGTGIAEAPVPGLVINQTLRPVTEYTRGLLREYRIPLVIGGLRNAVVAMSGVGRWSAVRTQERPISTLPESVALPPVDQRHGSWSEWRTRDLLAAAGVPVIPSVLAVNEDAAVSAAADLGRVAMKVVSADIVHKTDIGGVRLGVDAVDARDAYRSILDAVAANAPGATVEGILVSPMRTPAVELIVGVVADPDWGPMLAVGLGGVLVELLQDASLRRLPVGPDDVREMLGELRGRAVLDGVRGAEPVDVDALVTAICAVTALASALGDDLLSLEVNPLRADSDGVEALDAVRTWRDADPEQDDRTHVVKGEAP